MPAWSVKCTNFSGFHLIFVLIMKDNWFGVTIDQSPSQEDISKNMNCVDDDWLHYEQACKKQQQQQCCRSDDVERYNIVCPFVDCIATYWPGLPVAACVYRLVVFFLSTDSYALLDHSLDLCNITFIGFMPW